jgi:hypothetical protein
LHSGCNDNWKLLSVNNRAVTSSYGSNYLRVSHSCFLMSWSQCSALNAFLSYLSRSSLSHGLEINCLVFVLSVFSVTTRTYFKVASSCTSTSFNPLKPKLVYSLCKNPVRTSKRTPHFTITKINWLTLFKEIIFN